MKVFAVKDKKGKLSFYKNEENFLMFANNVIGSRWGDKNMEYFILEDVKSGKISDVISDKKTNDRDIQLKSVLGDLTEDEQLVLNFRNLYESLSKETLKNDEINWNIRQILHKFNLVGLDKEKMAKLINNEKEHILFEVSNSIEYYESILRIKNFNKLPIRYKYSISSKVIISNSESSENNFKEAKNKVKNGKK